MMKVFIGGSRRISRLNAEVREHLDRIIQSQMGVLVGDANGADKAVQTYFHERRYDHVQVFCSGQHCRNNVGSWNVIAVPVVHPRGSFEFYEAKDRRMTEESSLGLMLWDGKSKGTLSNVHRLLDMGKKVVLWIDPEKKFKTLKTRQDWQQFAAHKDALSEPRWAQSLLWK